MFRRMLAVALVAGISSGLALSVVQPFTTTPLILAAEAYEEVAVNPALHDGDPVLEAWAPADGLERALSLAAANVIAGVGCALLLIAAFTLYGRAVDGRHGLAWGAAGFTVFALGPSLGLPPEVPGAVAADLAARQAWWAFAVGCTALGLGLLVFGRRTLLAALGVLVIVLPHAMGAPHPAELGGPVPPELAGHFAAASLATAAVFWALLGVLSGVLYRRFVLPWVDERGEQARAETA